MKNAIADVSMQKKGLRQAAREYGVPVTTLKRRIDSSLPADCKPGPSPVLLKDEEDRLTSYIITMAERGFGLSPTDIRGLAYEIANNSGRKHPFTNGLTGKDWYQSFVQRRKLSLRTPQPLSYARSKNCNPKCWRIFWQTICTVCTL